jgi:hypothetical protein
MRRLVFFVMALLALFTFLRAYAQYSDEQHLDAQGPEPTYASVEGRE